MLSSVSRPVCVCVFRSRAAKASLPIRYVSSCFSASMGPVEDDGGGAAAPLSLGEFL